jgi:hypothetical protein
VPEVPRAVPVGQADRARRGRDGLRRARGDRPGGRGRAGAAVGRAHDQHAREGEERTGDEEEEVATHLLVARNDCAEWKVTFAVARTSPLGLTQRQIERSEEASMAGTEQVQDVVGTDQAPAVKEFAVEDPATGAVIAHCPDLGPEEIAAMVRRGREVQPAWAALGFEGRARILSRMQKWVIDHQDEVIAVIRSETGKTYEDALIAEVSYGAAAFGFWLLG